MEKNNINNKENNYILLEKINRDCPLCNKIHTLEKRQRDGKALIKNTPVSFIETYFFCSETRDGENEFVSAEMLGENIDRAREMYEKSKENKGEPPIPYDLIQEYFSAKFLYKCPQCNQDFNILGKKEKFCHNCGKKLDWRRCPEYSTEAFEKVFFAMKNNPDILYDIKQERIKKVMNDIYKEIRRKE